MFHLLQDDHDPRRMSPHTAGLESAGCVDSSIPARLDMPILVSRSLCIFARLESDSLMESRRINPECKGRRDDRKDDRHKDKHGKDLGVEDARGETDVEHDEFDQTVTIVSFASGMFSNDLPFTAHQHADREAFPRIEVVQLGRSCTTNEFAKEGHKDDSERVAPSFPVVEQSEIRLETRKNKVDRQKEQTDEVIDLFSDLAREPVLVRDDQSGKESAKDGVYSDNVGHERRYEDEEKGDDHDSRCRAVFE